MSTDIPGHSAPSASFEVPLEMISACHHRIERQCSTLRRLVPHVSIHGPDVDARTAAAAVVCYFDESAKHHHADEEEDLFPALMESVAASDAGWLRELTEGLAADHRELEALWEQLRVALRRVIAGDVVSVASSDVEAFVGLYERHIEREERELVPMAARLLSDADLERIGRAMRERRGIDSAG